jgi:uncharacterized membrane protein
LIHQTNIEALPVDQLKAKLMQLNKQLLEEQTRTVALEEEKKRPLNVHRWLALETTGICGSFTFMLRNAEVILWLFLCRKQSSYLVQQAQMLPKK